MNTIKSSANFILHFTSRGQSNGTPRSVFSCSQQRWMSSVVLSRTGPEQRIVQGTLRTKAEGACVFQQPLWHYQQVRTGKRGTEYQPNNIKRKRTHGWIKRISTPGGIEVILRRMLKGRKSLTH
ncbi:39S ribosomal protein L34 [Triplophysa rosa]|uniref:Large ribosomal subunit protein bL34m n=1 Tax=Triplophysa rosa TaxID=992332 RepID=A0A9W7WW36_TRIRA|nr:39S ribosomal protein L34 [Triplophysa rosa]